MPFLNTFLKNLNTESLIPLKSNPDFLAPSVTGFVFEDFLKTFLKNSPAEFFTFSKVFLMLGVNFLVSGSFEASYSGNLFLPFLTPKKASMPSPNVPIIPAATAAAFDFLRCCGFARLPAR